MLHWLFVLCLLVFDLEPVCYNETPLPNKEQNFDLITTQLRNIYLYL